MEPVDEGPTFETLVFDDDVFDAREDERPTDREEAKASLGPGLRHEMPDERTASSDDAVVGQVLQGGDINEPGTLPETQEKPE